MRKGLLGFVAICVGVALWAVAELWTEAHALGWQEVPARVTESDVNMLVVYQSTTKSLRPVDRELYEWRFQYAYRLDGLDYVGTRIGLVDTPIWNRDAAMAMAMKYPVGADVVAYVSPDDPAFALLEPGPSFGAGLLLVFSILAAFGAAWLLPATKDRRTCRA